MEVFLETGTVIPRIFVIDRGSCHVPGSAWPSKQLKQADFTNLIDGHRLGNELYEPILYTPPAIAFIATVRAFLQD
jgi:hypothetical protein